MIASLIEPVTYDRMALLRVLLGAGALVLALFLILALLCIAQGLRHRQDRASKSAWRKHGK